MNNWMYVTDFSVTSFASLDDLIWMSFLTSFLLSLFSSLCVPLCVLAVLSKGNPAWMIISAHPHIPCLFRKQAKWIITLINPRSCSNYWHFNEGSKIDRTLEMNPFCNSVWHLHAILMVFLISHDPSLPSDPLHRAQMRHLINTLSVVWGHGLTRKQVLGEVLCFGLIKHNAAEQIHSRVRFWPVR